MCWRRTTPLCSLRRRLIWLTNQQGGANLLLRRVHITWRRGQGSPGPSRHSPWTGRQTDSLTSTPRLFLYGQLNLISLIIHSEFDSLENEYKNLLPSILNHILYLHRCYYIEMMVWEGNYVVLVLWVSVRCRWVVVQGQLRLWERGNGKGRCDGRWKLQKRSHLHRVWQGRLVKNKKRDGGIYSCTPTRR